MRDELVRATSGSGGLAVWAIVGTDLVSEAARRHGTSPTASAALGRALMGAALLAAGAKNGETVQLQFRGSGPLGSMVAIADAAGRVRGYASNPSAHPPPRDGQLDLPAALGRGVLAVVRHRPGWHPYSGIVPLTAGTVAQDIAQYLATSEQARTAVALGVYLGDERIEAAGGFFVHALPGASDDEIEQAEENVRGYPGPGEMVREGLDATAIAEHLLTGLAPRELERSQPRFDCPCGRERAVRTLLLLGEKDITGAARRKEVLEVRCEFCGERYRVDPVEIADRLREEAAS
jgi:molecular chaperone Hsp33